MVQENLIDQSALSVWQAELLRLTIFPSSPSMDFIKQNWWEKLTGKTPTDTKQPRQLERRDEGSYKNGKLILNTTPVRIDWIYAASDEETDQLLTKFSTLGLFENALRDFDELVLKWFSLQTLTLTRMAFGGVVLQQVNHLAEGYELLSSRYLKLPLKLDNQNTSDFLYRINRRRQSNTNVSELIVNRLSTWTVAMVQNIALMSSGGQTLQQTLDDPLYAVRLELDINTNPQGANDLPSESIVDVFHELSSLGTEIALKGDIP